MSFHDNNNKDLWAKQQTSNSSQYSNNNSNHNNNANFHHHEVNCDGNTAASIGALFGGGGGGSIGSGTLYNHLNNMNSNNYNFYQQQQLMNNDNNWQVVPDSLDHLSRDELCRMIYRLDYERNTLQDSLMRNEQLLMMQQQLYNGSRSCRQRNNDDMSTVRKKGKKRTRFALDDNYWGEEEVVVEQLGASKEDEEELIVQQNDHDGSYMTQAQQAYQNLHQPISLNEIEELQKLLHERITTAIKSSTHGGRKVPKSTVTLHDVHINLARALMSNHDTQMISDTKRMIKWNLVNDIDIIKVLNCENERFVYPVKHDGAGYIFSSTFTDNTATGSNAYCWAKFVGMEVRYDKKERLLSLIVKTKECTSDGK